MGAGKMFSSNNFKVDVKFVCKMGVEREGEMVREILRAERDRLTETEGERRGEGERDGTGVGGLGQRGSK